MGAVEIVALITYQRGSACYHALIESCRSGNGLECGAGTVETVGAAVYQRRICSLKEVIVVFRIVLEVVCGCGSHALNGACFSVQYADSSALGIEYAGLRVDSREACDEVIKYALQLQLEASVHCELYSLA